MEVLDGIYERDKTSSRPGRTPANVISSGELTASSPIDFQLWEMRFFNLKEVPPRSNRWDARSRHRRNTSQTALTARKLATAWGIPRSLRREWEREDERENRREREREQKRGREKERERKRKREREKKRENIFPNYELPSLSLLS